MTFNGTAHAAPSRRERKPPPRGLQLLSDEEFYRPLEPGEAERVRRFVQAEGQLRRIVPTRMLESEQRSDPRTPAGGFRYHHGPTSIVRECIFEELGEFAFMPTERVIGPFPAARDAWVRLYDLAMKIMVRDRTRRARGTALRILPWLEVNEPGRRRTLGRVQRAAKALDLPVRQREIRAAARILRTYDPSARIRRALDRAKGTRRSPRGIRVSYR